MPASRSSPALVRPWLPLKSKGASHKLIHEVAFVTVQCKWGTVSDTVITFISSYACWYPEQGLSAFPGHAEVCSSIATRRVPPLDSGFALPAGAPHFLKDLNSISAGSAHTVVLLHPDHAAVSSSEPASITLPCQGFSGICQSPGPRGAQADVAFSWPCGAVLQREAS